MQQSRHDTQRAHPELLPSVEEAVRPARPRPRDHYGLAPRRGAGLDTPAEVKPWIERLARLGYAVKGVVYLLIAWLAVEAARGAHATPNGSRDAFRMVLAAPLGRVLLGIVAAGLAGYALWRLVAAITDAEHKGHDAKGLAVRAYYLGSGLVHGALAVAAVRMLLGSGGGSRGDQTPGRTATLMDRPFGRWLVGLVALAVFAAAVQQVRLALGGYRKKVASGGMPASVQRWLPRVAAAGLLARALVFAVIGGFLLLAAIHADPHRAHGLGGALATLATTPAGPWLLGVVALGLAAYGVFQLVEARWRPIRA